MMSIHAAFFTLFRMKSCSSSRTAHRCHRHLRPSSSYSLLLRRSLWADSIRGWETMKPVWLHVKELFLQKLVLMPPVYAQSAQVPYCGLHASVLCRQRTLRKLDELRLNILSTSLTCALRRVAVPAPLVVVVVAAPLI